MAEQIPQELDAIFKDLVTDLVRLFRYAQAHTQAAPVQQQVQEQQPETPAQPEPVKKSNGLSAADVSKAVVSLSGSVDKSKLAHVMGELLKFYSVARVSELPPDTRQAFLDELERRLGA